MLRIAFLIAAACVQTAGCCEGSKTWNNVYDASGHYQQDWPDNNPPSVPSGTDYLILQENSFVALGKLPWKTMQDLLGLDLSHNLLTSNGTQHPRWETLNFLGTLCLNNNVLDGVPRFLWVLNNTLRHLDLSHNEIDHVSPSDSLVALSGLQTLTLSENSIHHVPNGTFCGLPLRQLLLNNNQLHAIPQLGCLGNTLQLLRLRGNLIQVIHGSDMRGLTSLRNLDLSANHIVSIGGLQNVRDNRHLTLNLRNNSISSVDETLQNFSLVQNLMLSLNNLLSWSPDALQGSVIRRLTLSYSNVTCFLLVSNIEQRYLNSTACDCLKMGVECL